MCVCLLSSQTCRSCTIAQEAHTQITERSSSDAKRPIAAIEKYTHIETSCTLYMYMYAVQTKRDYDCVFHAWKAQPVLVKRYCFHCNLTGVGKNKKWLQEKSSFKTRKPIDRLARSLSRVQSNHVKDPHSHKTTKILFSETSWGQQTRIVGNFNSFGQNKRA